jgi:sulfide dehydrogenase cytochrome subunit
MIAVMAALSAAPVIAADSAFTEACQVCHGPDGVARWPDIPNISGLPEVVIANALYDFRGRARPCRSAACAATGDCPEADMCALSAGLTDEEIERFARYYAAQPFSPSVAAIKLDKAARGETLHERRCEECHSDGGSNPKDQASILRGQNLDYLRTAIDDYRAGRRALEEPMAKAIGDLSDDDIEALLHFYGSPTR